MPKKREQAENRVKPAFSSDDITASAATLVAIFPFQLYLCFVACATDAAEA